MTYEDTTQGDKEVTTAQLKLLKAAYTVPSRPEILAQEVSAKQLQGEAQVFHARTRTHTHTHTHYTHTHTHTHTRHTSHLRNSLARQPSSEL